MAQVDLVIAGRPYQIACREGEEENLRAAARVVDAKSREALSGLGTLSESRQLLFASLLLAGCFSFSSAPPVRSTTIVQCAPGTRPYADGVCR